MHQTNHKADLFSALKDAGLTWHDEPEFAVSDGSSFQPRGAIFREDKPVAIVCVVPNDHIEPGLTTDLCAARDVPMIQHIIHLRPQANTALVGTRIADNFRYRFTDQSVAIKGTTLSVKDLSTALSVDYQPGWTDLPLSGRNLPTFADMNSFLSWWDFYPGKQRFEIEEGQVVLVERLSAPSGETAELLGALRNQIPDHLIALPNMLVRVDDLTAVCPDISIAIKPVAREAFVDAKIAIFASDSCNSSKARNRALLVEKSGTQALIFDVVTKSFALPNGTPIDPVRVGTVEIEAQSLCSDALK